MVVHNLNIIGVAVLPTKAQPALIVDADAMLATSIFGQPLQVVARNREVPETRSRVQLLDLSERLLRDGA